MSVDLPVRSTRRKKAEEDLFRQSMGFDEEEAFQQAMGQERLGELAQSWSRPVDTAIPVPTAGPAPVPTAAPIYQPTRGEETRFETQAREFQEQTSPYPAVSIGAETAFARKETPFTRMPERNAPLELLDWATRTFDAYSEFITGLVEMEERLAEKLGIPGRYIDPLNLSSDVLIEALQDVESTPGKTFTELYERFRERPWYQQLGLSLATETAIPVAGAPKGLSTILDASVRVVVAGVRRSGRLAAMSRDLVGSALQREVRQVVDDVVPKDAPADAIDEAVEILADDVVREAPAAAREAAEPKTYQEFQNAIDDMEDVLEEQGVDIYSLDFMANMPEELDSLYKARDAVGAAEDTAEVAQTIGRVSQTSLEGPAFPVSRETIESFLEEQLKNRNFRQTMGYGEQLSPRDLEDVRRNLYHTMVRNAKGDWAFLRNWSLADIEDVAVDFRRSGWGRNPQPVLNQMDAILRDIVGDIPSRPAGALPPAAAAEGVTKEPYYMTKAEFEDTLEQLRVSEANIEVEVFGEEGAEIYKRAERTANSSTVDPNSARMKAAEKTIADMEDTLTEEQYNHLVGMRAPGELPFPAESFDSLKEFRSAFEDFSDMPTEFLLGQVRRGLTTVRGNKIKDFIAGTGKLKDFEQVAAMKIRHALEALNERGMSQEQIFQQVGQDLARDLDPDDAAFLLRDFLDAKPTTTAPEFIEDIGLGPRRTQGKDVLGRPTGFGGGVRRAGDDDAERLAFLKNLIQRAKDAEQEAFLTRHRGSLPLTPGTPGYRPPPRPTAAQLADIIEDAKTDLTDAQAALKEATSRGDDAEDLAELSANVRDARSALRKAKKPFDDAEWERLTAAADKFDKEVAEGERKILEEIAELEARLAPAPAAAADEAVRRTDELVDQMRGRADPTAVELGPETFRAGARGVGGEIPPTRPIGETGAPRDPLPPGHSVMGDFPEDFEQVVQIATREDVWRKILNLPGLRILGAFNPSAVANDPAKQALVGRAVRREETRQLSQAAMAPLNALGTQEQIFGALTPEGLIRKGPLEGLAVNDIRSNPAKYADKTTPAMKEWIQVADDTERAKLAFLRNNGIEINELSFPEGGQYAGRRIWGKFTRGDAPGAQEGELLEVGFVGPGPGRPGAKLAQEKHRVFTTQQEAIEAGYRYIPDDEALALNVTGAYYKVADKQMTEWLLSKVDWRGTGTPEALKVAQLVAERRLASAKRSIDALNRAIRGESLPTGTVNAIERIFPELSGRLRPITKIHVEDVLRAAKVLEQPERVLEVPKPGAIIKVQKLIAAVEEKLLLAPNDAALLRERSRLRSSLGFIRYRIGLGEDLVIPHQPVKELRSSAIAELTEIRDAIRGVLKPVPGRKTPRFQGGWIDDVRKEVLEATALAKAGRERALTTGVSEARVPVPAFAGKILTGPDAAKTAETLRKGFDPHFSTVLDNINQVEAVSRFFMLAGDISALGIQLFYMAGAKPRVYAGAAEGTVRAIFDTRFQAKFLARPENQDIIRRYPTLILAARGGTEFTEAMARGGLLQRGPFKVAAKVLLVKPFMRGFEGAIDVAGIEMVKGFDHLGDTAAARNEIAAFVNQFRGLSSSGRLGVSLVHRQAETTSLLAPNYNRAIAALAFSTIRGGLRGHLARTTLARSFTAMVTMAMAISLGIEQRHGKDIRSMEAWKNALKHVTPGDPKFFTWEVAGQNIGPGTKIRSIMNLFADTIEDPESLTEFGPYSWMRNPPLRFIRGNLAPMKGFALNIITGRDYIGDETRDGMLSISKEVLSHFMYIWLQTAVLEGGTLEQRALRGAAEFAGQRAYPVNITWKLRSEWSDDIDAYEEIETTREKRIEKGQPRGLSRIKYRERNPDVDAKMFITGRVKSLETGAAKRKARELLRENNVFTYHVPPDVLEVWKKVLGSSHIEKIQKEQGAEVEARRPAATPAPGSDESSGVLSDIMNNFPLPIGR